MLPGLENLSLAPLQCPPIGAPLSDEPPGLPQQDPAENEAQLARDLDGAWIAYRNTFNWLPPEIMRLQEHPLNDLNESVQAVRTLWSLRRTTGDTPEARSNIQAVIDRYQRAKKRVVSNARAMAYVPDLSNRTTNLVIASETFLSNVRAAWPLYREMSNAAAAARLGAEKARNRNRLFGRS